MDTSNATHITSLLADVRNGDLAALDQLVRSIYEELRVVARRLMAEEGTGHTLQPTALVHEALLRILEPGTLKKLVISGDFFV